MQKLFDKLSSTSTAYNSLYIEDSTLSLKDNQYQNFIIKINNAYYTITSNTSNKLYFANSLTANYSYEILFIDRDYLTKFDSDLSDTSRISDDLISKKYELVNIELSKELFFYLKPKITTTYNPLNYIGNLYDLQNLFSYKLLALIYADLSIQYESFETYKSQEFAKKYKELKPSYFALINIDANADGIIDNDELKANLNSDYFLKV